jgi:hypothetical protein
MARTKNQARARQSESARKSAAVSDGEESRVGTTTVRAEGGDEASSSSSSERARRADGREKATRQRAKAAATRDNDIQQQTTVAAADDGDKYSGDIYMTPATGGAVSENYYTALEGLEEDAYTEDSAGGSSEASNIKSPLKPRQERQSGRQAQRGGACRQLSGSRGGAEMKGRRKTETESRADAGGSEGNAPGQTRRGGDRSAKRKDGDYMGRVRPKVEAC